MKALVWRRESSFSLLLFVLFFEKSQLVNATWTTRPNKSRRRWLRLAANTGKRLQRDGRCPRFSNADAFSIWAHFHAMQRPLLGILLVGWTFVFVVGFQMDGHLRARQPDSQAGTQARRQSASTCVWQAKWMRCCWVRNGNQSSARRFFFSSVTRSPNLALEFVVRLAAFASPVELKIIEADMVEVDAREQL